MHTALKIILKDFKRRIKDPLSIILLLSFPLLLTLIIGLAFGPAGKGTLPATEILLADLDQGIVTEFMRSAFTHGGEEAPPVQLRQVGEEEGRKAIAGGEGSALLIIPRGFSEDFLDGKSVRMTLLKNPSQSILPEVAEQYAEFQAFLGSFISRLFEDELKVVRNFQEMEDLAPRAQWTALINGVYDKLSAIEKYLFPMPISIEEREVAGAKEKKEEGGINVFAIVLPGFAIFGLFFVAQVVFRDILNERSSGTLARLFSSPVSVESFLAGKAAGGFLISLCALLLLQLVSTLAFRVNWGPLGSLLALDGVAILGVSGVCLFVFSLAKTGLQGDAILMVIIMSMALFGGSMIPLDQMPEIFKSISHFSLNAHAIVAYRSLMDTGSLSSALPRLLLLAGFGCATIFLGILFLRRGILRGD